MPIVPAKCPQCGGDIEVDSTKDAAICKFCGTAFIVEKAINNYNTTINKTINNNFAGATININNMQNADNLYMLGVDSYNGGSFQEAYNYFTKSLEIDGNNPNAIIARGLAMARLSYINKNDGRYSINLSMALQGIDRVCKDNNLMGISIDSFNNNILEMVNILYWVSDYINSFYVPKSMNTDNINFINSLLRVCYDASNQLLEIYKNFIEDKDDNEDSSKIYLKISYCVIRIMHYLLLEREYTVAWGMRSGLGQINKAKIPEYKEILKKKNDFILELQNKYPDEKTLQSISVSSSEDNNIKNNYGCYIATCVYNSYDCPQVWRLRRYRDNYLDKRWWGRAFIKIYYLISPKIVKLFGKKNWFRKPVKKILDKKIRHLENKGYDDSPYFDKY